ncbi:MAG: hypothetical protein PUD59_03080 [bacterium]|nr:hypothetical protein [bacterium]
MKVILKYSTMLLLIFLCCACSKSTATKIIRKDYINENNGVFFNNYALAIDQEVENSAKYAVFKSNGSGTYKKLFNIDEYSNEDTLLATDKYIYIFYKKGGFIGYNLSSTNNLIKKVEPDFASIDGLIYYPKEIFGYKDGYIYLSYYSDDSSNTLLFAKIKDNLISYESLKSHNEVPVDLINYIEK